MCYERYCHQTYKTVMCIYYETNQVTTLKYINNQWHVTNDSDNLNALGCVVSNLLGIADCIFT